MEAVDVQATFCATLVDEWARAGVVDAVVSPGSRSTPLALALLDDPRVRVHVHVDERSAGFTALGLARATGRPAVVLTTSGTAAAELHPSLVEADLAGVPLLVCTADRPVELRHVGAPQTIDQAQLFGRAVRWFIDPGVADDAMRARWRAIGARAVAETTGACPGPVHLNLPFREPLHGKPGDLPPGRAAGPWTAREALAGRVPALAGLLDLSGAAELAGRRGVVVAGEGSGPAEQVEALAGALGWPVLADPRAAARRPSPVVVVHPDAALRAPAVAAELRPEVVVRLGAAPASRVVAEWVAASGAVELVAAGTGRWLDPTGTVATVVDAPAEAAANAWAREAAAASTTPDPRWLAAWRRVDDAVAAALGDVLSAEAGPTEPAVARDLLASLPDGAALVVSSSMPVRDLEWYAAPRGGVTVHANRGANGIDGVVSTAVGVALGSAAPTALLIGDLAFLHDSNGLLGAAGRGIDLVAVVVDNNGGGIFSFLPQADTVSPERFERLFGTPHGLDLVAVAASLGVRARATDDVVAATKEALAAGGVHVLVVRTDRAANADLRRRLSAAAADRASAALT